MPATILRARSARWPIGRRRPFASSISNTPDRSSMPRPGPLLAIACASALPLALLVNGAPAATPNQQDFAQIEHGRYRATRADCVACYANKDGGLPIVGVRPIETRFGMIFSANITPAPCTGIGNWT